MLTMKLSKLRMHSNNNFTGFLRSDLGYLKNKRLIQQRLRND